MPTPAPTHPVVRTVRAVARHPLTRGLVGVTALVVGLGLAALAMGVGHCSFAGGTCPAEPVPVWQDDVFGPWPRDS